MSSGPASATSTSATTNLGQYIIQGIGGSSSDTITSASSTAVVLSSLHELHTMNTSSVTASSIQHNTTASTHANNVTDLAAAYSAAWTCLSSWRGWEGVLLTQQYSVLSSYSTKAIYITTYSAETWFHTKILGLQETVTTPCDGKPRASLLPFSGNYSTTLVPYTTVPASTATYTSSILVGESTVATLGHVPPRPACTLDNQQCSVMVSAWDDYFIYEGNLNNSHFSTKFYSTLAPIQPTPLCTQSYLTHYNYEPMDGLCQMYVGRPELFYCRLKFERPIVVIADSD